MPKDIKLIKDIKLTKDDVLTIPVPGSNLVFTRYLYLKDEVRVALLLSILNKSDDAIFWAYELYYSGYKNELFAFIWQIYYDFFATQNPSFAPYLAKKLASKEIEDRLVSSIIQNLLIRSFNTDVFLLRTISECFELDVENKVEEDLERMLENKDYRKLATYILGNKEQKEIDIYKRALNYFKLTNQKKMINELTTLMPNSKSINIILLANVLSLITFDKSQTKKVNFYVHVHPEEVVQYETIESVDDLKPYRILRQACVCQIDRHSFQNLFQSFRNQKIQNGLKEKYDSWTSRAISEKYSDNWLYHAAFSPIWFNRIKISKGYIDYQKNKVKFINEDCEEEFYNNYGYEPDEQPNFVKENILGKCVNSKSTWQQFFAKYKRCSLIDTDEDELEELNSEPLKY
jgi:hypothetical protein